MADQEPQMKLITQLVWLGDTMTLLQEVNELYCEVRYEGTQYSFEKCERRDSLSEGLSLFVHNTEALALRTSRSDVEIYGQQKAQIYNPAM